MAEIESAVSGGACVHRWQIASPVGDECSGTCKLCGAERCFTNARYAFGQPGRARRPVPPPKLAPLPHPGEPGGLAQFLARSVTLPSDAARPI